MIWIKQNAKCLPVTQIHAKGRLWHLSVRRHRGSLALLNVVWYTRCHISSRILWSSGFRSGLLGACDIDIHPIQERHAICQSFDFPA